MKLLNASQLARMLEQADPLATMTSANFHCGQLRLHRMLRKSLQEDLNQAINIEDLLFWEGEQFVFNCYRRILGRFPDEDGFKFHIAAIKEGRRTKVQLIKLMRLSKEGREIGRKITHFWPEVWSDFLRRRVFKTIAMPLSDQA